jgi:hypothetical protein
MHSNAESKKVRLSSAPIIVDDEKSTFALPVSVKFKPRTMSTGRMTTEMERYNEEKRLTEEHHNLQELKKYVDQSTSGNQAHSDDIDSRMSEFKAHRELMIAEEKRLVKAADRMRRGKKYEQPNYDLNPETQKMNIPLGTNKRDFSYIKDPPKQDALNTAASTATVTGLQRPSSPKVKGVQRRPLSSGTINISDMNGGMVMNKSKEKEKVKKQHPLLRKSTSEMSEEEMNIARFLRDNQPPTYEGTQPDSARSNPVELILVPPGKEVGAAATTINTTTAIDTETPINNFVNEVNTVTKKEIKLSKAGANEDKDTSIASQDVADSPRDEDEDEDDHGGIGVFTQPSVVVDEQLQNHHDGTKFNVKLSKKGLLLNKKTAADMPLVSGQSIMKGMIGVPGTGTTSKKGSTNTDIQVNIPISNSLNCSFRIEEEKSTDLSHDGDSPMRKEISRPNSPVMHAAISYVHNAIGEALNSLSPSLDESRCDSTLTGVVITTKEEVITTSATVKAIVIPQNESGNTEAQPNTADGSEKNSSRPNSQDGESNNRKKLNEAKLLDKKHSAPANAKVLNKSRVTTKDSLMMVGSKTGTNYVTGVIENPSTAVATSIVNKASKYSILQKNKLDAASHKPPAGGNNAKLTPAFRSVVGQKHDLEQVQAKIAENVTQGNNSHVPLHRPDSSGSPTRVKSQQYLAIDDSCILSPPPSVTPIPRSLKKSSPVGTINAIIDSVKSTDDSRISMNKEGSQPVTMDLDAGLELFKDISNTVNLIKESKANSNSTSPGHYIPGSDATNEATEVITANPDHVGFLMNKWTPHDSSTSMELMEYEQGQDMLQIQMNDSIDIANMDDSVVVAIQEKGHDSTESNDIHNDRELHCNSPVSTKIPTPRVLKLAAKAAESARNSPDVFKNSDEGNEKTTKSKKENVTIDLSLTEEYGDGNENVANHNNLFTPDDMKDLSLYKHSEIEQSTMSLEQFSAFKILNNHEFTLDNTEMYHTLGGTITHDNINNKQRYQAENVNVNIDCVGNRLNKVPPVTSSFKAKLKVRGTETTAEEYVTQEEKRNIALYALRQHEKYKSIMQQKRDRSIAIAIAEAEKKRSYSDSVKEVDSREQEEGEPIIFLDEKAFKHLNSQKKKYARMSDKKMRSDEESKLINKGMKLLNDEEIQEKKQSRLTHKNSKRVLEYLEITGIIERFEPVMTSSVSANKKGKGNRNDNEYNNSSDILASEKIEFINPNSSSEFMSQKNYSNYNTSSAFSADYANIEEAKRRKDDLIPTIVHLKHKLMMDIATKKQLQLQQQQQNGSKSVVADSISNYPNILGEDSWEIVEQDVFVQNNESSNRINIKGGSNKYNNKNLEGPESFDSHEDSDAVAVKDGLQSSLELELREERDVYEARLKQITNMNTNANSSIGYLGDSQASGGFNLNATSIDNANQFLGTASDVMNDIMADYSLPCDNSQANATGTGGDHLVHTTATATNSASAGNEQLIDEDGDLINTPSLGIGLAESTVVGAKSGEIVDLIDPRHIHKVAFESSGAIAVGAAALETSLGELGDSHIRLNVADTTRDQENRDQQAYETANMAWNPGAGVKTGTRKKKLEYLDTMGAGFITGEGSLTEGSLLSGLESDQSNSIYSYSRNQTQAIHAPAMAGHSLRPGHGIMHHKLVSAGTKRSGTTEKLLNLFSSSTRASANATANDPIIGDSDKRPHSAPLNVPKRHIRAGSQHIMPDGNPTLDQGSYINKLNVTGAQAKTRIGSGRSSNGNYSNSRGSGVIFNQIQSQSDHGANTTNMHVNMNPRYTGNSSSIRDRRGEERTLAKETLLKESMKSAQSQMNLNMNTNATKKNGIKARPGTADATCTNVGKNSPFNHTSAGIGAHSSTKTKNGPGLRVVNWKYAHPSVPANEIDTDRTNNIDFPMGNYNGDEIMMANAHYLEQPSMTSIDRDFDYIQFASSVEGQAIEHPGMGMAKKHIGFGNNSINHINQEKISKGGPNKSNKSNKNNKKMRVTSKLGIGTEGSFHMLEVDPEKNLDYFFEGDIIQSDNNTYMNIDTKTDTNTITTNSSPFLSPKTKKSERIQLVPELQPAAPQSRIKYAMPNKTVELMTDQLIEKGY